MESLASQNIEKKNENEVKEAIWTPGNFETLEDVPGWEKQFAYFDIAKVQVEAFLNTDLRFSPNDLSVAQKVVNKFNRWIEERIQHLDPVAKKEIENRFGRYPAKIIMNDNKKISSPFKVVFSYIPNPSDYKDIFEYEERAPQEDNDLLEHEEGQDSLDQISNVNISFLKKPMDSKWWPKGLLPSRNRVEE